MTAPNFAHMRWRIRAWWLRKLVKEAESMSLRHWNVARADLQDHLKKEPKHDRA